MGDLVGCAFAYRLGEFTDLFAEPGNCRRNSAVAVSIAVGVVDHLLEFAQVHTVTVPGALVVWSVSYVTSVGSGTLDALTTATAIDYPVVEIQSVGIGYG